MVPRLGSIGSKVWEPAVLQTGTPKFQDWEALFQGLETSSSLNWEPVVPRLGSIGSKVGTCGSNWETQVPKFGNRSFVELGTRGSKIGNSSNLETRGSKIGKQRFQGLGTVSL